MAVSVLPESSAEARFRVAGGRQGFTSEVPQTWQRPADWLSLGSISASDNKFVGLLAVTDDDTNFLALSAAGNYTVDWGDGVTENVTSGTTAYHQYTYSSISSATASSRGYRQVLVTVTPQAGQSFTSINIRIKHNQTGLNAYEVKWLDVAIAGSSLTSITIGASSEAVATRWLEQARILSSAVTTWANQFENCRRLQSVSVASSGTVTSTASMFRSCMALTTVPMFATASVTTMVSMFNTCNALQTVPHFNTASVTTTASMFQNCNSLLTVPPLNMGSVTTATDMFSGCFSLQSVPLFNLASVTTAPRMFQDCYSLQAIPLFNLAAVTDATSMFSGCRSIQTVPLLNMGAATTTASMFNSCLNLQTVPALTTTSATNMSSMFNNCPTLQSVGLISTAAVSSSTNSANMFASCPSLAVGATSGLRYATTYASANLSKGALESIFDNLGKADGAQTITITSNWGAPTAISKTSSGTTSGSTTVTIANTASLVVGMEISGTGISDAVAVTFQDTGDTVTRTAHGIPNDTPVSFASITSTTGIATYTTYYVVNSTANTFQVSDTVGGSAKALTTDGSGTVLYGTTITAISTNVSVTLSIPASATGSVTTSSALLKRSKARLKGWTVSP